MSGKDMLTLLLCSFGFDRNMKVEVEYVGYEEPAYMIYAENKDGEVYSEFNCEGLMFNIYKIIAYMTKYNDFLNHPSDETSKLDLRELYFESGWWDIAPKHILNESERNSIIKERDENEKLKEL